MAQHDIDIALPAGARAGQIVQQLGSVRGVDEEDGRAGGSVVVERNRRRLAVATAVGSPHAPLAQAGSVDRTFGQPLQPQLEFFDLGWIHLPQLAHRRVRRDAKRVQHEPLFVGKGLGADDVTP